MPPTRSSFSTTYTATTDNQTLDFQQSLIELEQALEYNDLDTARAICAQLQERSLSPRIFQDMDLRDPGKVVSVATLTRSSR